MSKKDSYEFTGEEAEMDLKIKGKSAVVTGGGKGIGRACALALAKEGTNVCINDLDPETGNETLNDIKALERWTFSWTAKGYTWALRSAGCWRRW